MCDTTHSYVRHDSFICVTWLLHTCDITWYGVALVSRIDKMIGLFCKRAPWKRRYSSKETCHFIDPTDRSHPIPARGHLYVWHDSSICATWLIHVRDTTPMCDITSYLRLLLEAIYMCDMTHSYKWHDSFICVTWPLHMCDMTPSYVWHNFILVVTARGHSYVWHDSFICVTRLIHMCDTTHSYVWHESFMSVP